MPKPQFIGLDTVYRTANGEQKRRIHMDGAASPLASSTALSTIHKILPHYSNTHSYVHTSAHISTKALDWAHRQTLEFVGASNETYTAIFTGTGSTAPINRIAKGLHLLRPDRPIALVSSMEHHANDLPHREHAKEIIYIPLTGEGAQQGAVDLDELEKLLKTHSGKVNYIAVSAVSNVTGIINPIKEITQLAHSYNALVVVDGAQEVAHLPVTLSVIDDQSGSQEVDFYIFSGHKLYTPMAPGVLIAKKVLLENMPGQDLGGGSVSDVSYQDYILHKNFPDREQSGTPNIVGAIALGSVMQELKIYKTEEKEQHGYQLMSKLLERLSNTPNIIVYGASTHRKRIGAIAFNHKLIDHGLLAAILNDYYAIAVRNECFCAHPYVSSMLKESLWNLDLDNILEHEQEAYINRKRGMVRVSLSLYNTEEDINFLISALGEIDEKIATLKENYFAINNGSYQHKSFTFDWNEYLKL